MALSVITFDVGTNNHAAWFDATVVRTTADTHSGAGALSWTANAAFSGVELNNAPYFSGVTAGETLECSVWVKGASGSYDTSIAWDISFYNEVGSQQGSTTSIPVTVSGSWSQSTPQQIVVPTGATRVGWTFFCNGAGTGSVILIDDVALTAPAAGGTGSASGTLAFVGTAAGKREAKGSAVGTLALTGSAAGARQPVATAGGTLAWVGLALAGVIEFPPRILAARPHIPTAAGSLAIDKTQATLSAPNATGVLR